MIGIRKYRRCVALGLVMMLGCGAFLLPCRAQVFRGSHEVIIHEIAWMGTTAAAGQQWIELYNPGRDAVDLAGWTLRCRDHEFVADLDGVIGPGDSYVLMHEDYPALPGVPVAATFAGQWCSSGERLLLEDAHGRLVDRVHDWHAGDEATRATMQRVYPYRAGYRRSSWATARVRYDLGYGTPGFRDPTHATGQALNAVYHAPDSINVYFNQPALTQYAMPGNTANHRINLEERILHRLRQATERIDITIYELNLPQLTDLLVRQAATGVRVRVIADSKIPNPDDAERVERWAVARLRLEQLLRGADGVPGSADSAVLFANAPIFAFIDDPARREAFGLPPRPDDLPHKALGGGATVREGFLLAKGERREDGSYFRPGAQMHNKFIVIDDAWVWTSSMNFTITDLYGSEFNQRRQRLRGNTNNGVEIHSAELAAIYTGEFNRMWGHDGDEPDPDRARFSGRKPARAGPHRLVVGERPVDVLFSPGYDVIGHMARLIEAEAQERVYFAIFAWSDHGLEQALKKKWEGSLDDRAGARTGFEIRGVFNFWDEWWSAAINMTGRDAEQASTQNPNIRWRHPAPVYRQQEGRRLHHKYLLIDPDTPHNPVVITGSANWSNNANTINDENSLFIYCPLIVNQYVQDFQGVYARARATSAVKKRR